MKKEKNKNLKDFNTFGISENCDNFFVIENKEELKKIDFSDNFLVLGGGSNLLITKKIDNVVYMNNKGIEIIEVNKEKVFLKAEAGEIWDDFVSFCVNNNFYGAENLSHIPGTVGASPIQNIGAYGTEAKDIIEKVEVFDIKSKTFYFLNNSECEFDYRWSIFKGKLKDKVIVTSVIFRLYTTEKFNLNYADLKDLLNKKDLKLTEVRQKIIEIRSAKLPDTKVIGNCGSFFKNAIVDEQKFSELKEIYPQIPSYKTQEGYKIPTAWLIENTDLKGYRKGNVGVYDKHSLVLVNFGNATGSEILSLANFVEKSVFIKFGIEIEKEVNVI